MNLFLDVMNATKNLNPNSNNTSNNKDSKLRNQLSICTYPDEAKYIIEKSVKQVFHVYPFFDSQILTFPQNNVQKKYIELKAILEIQVKGKVCKIDYNMMIPYGFPNKSPYVRIINRNTEFNVDPFYKNLRSPTDPKSFILNEVLSDIANWNPNKSIVSIITQSQELFRKRFPFTKPIDKSGFKSQQGWGGSPWQQPQMINQGYNQQHYHQQQYNQPPIPFGGHTNINSMIAGAQKSAGVAKQKLELNRAEHKKTLDKIQNLETINKSIHSETNFLEKQNGQMTAFLRKNQGNHKENLTNMIKPADGLSQQILDLISTIKAREDTIILLESKFTSQSISFDEFLKNMRKIQEEKFDQKALLQKCITMRNY